jgi:E3 ubiquitin-protein ligase BIG BROTHER and related proteins
MAINERIIELERQELDCMLNPEPEMTYEQLIELGEQIGTVSKGLLIEEVMKLPSVKLTTPKTCSICLVTMNPGDFATELHPCGHYYDFECIKTWLELSKKCPVCSQEVLID